MPINQNFKIVVHLNEKKLQKAPPPFEGKHPAKQHIADKKVKTWASG